MQADFSSVQDGESEDDFDWEEVAVPLGDETNLSILPAEEPIASGSSTPAANIEITIRTKPKQDEAAK
jgi:xeroderma pigmentosum group C-complementing protein